MFSRSTWERTTIWPSHSAPRNCSPESAPCFGDGSRLPRCRSWSGWVSVDLSRHSVLEDGQEVRLSPTEYLLVAELARHAHQVMDYRTLLHEVWGPAYGDERHYLRVFIQRLRLKLEHDPAHPEVIQTAPGRGYRFGPAAER